MKRLIIIVSVAIILLAIAGSVGAITDGAPDGNDHPSIGAIIGLRSNGTKFVVCTGVLVHPQALLTAGHCTNYIQQFIDAGVATLADHVRISFDSADALNNGHLVAKEMYTHPGYWGAGPETGNLLNDVGLLILAQPASAPVTPLPAAGFLDALRATGQLREGSDGADFAVVGYGATLEWPPAESTGGDGVRRAAVSEFLNLRSTWLHMSQNQAPGNENGGTCWGDSGGPTFWLGADGQEVLVALTSWGDNPCVATGTAWRVDIPETLGFVYYVLSTLD